MSEPLRSAKILVDRILGTPHVPDTLTALGATAIGALAGLLAPSPKGK